MNYDRLVKEKLERAASFKRACCNDTHNLRYPMDENSKPGQIILRCKVCHARHRRMISEGGRVGAKF